VRNINDNIKMKKGAIMKMKKQKEN